ncbi:MAG: hypothetical protein SFU25_06410 [Candidatus Caenarcaniphilales bacterium]|nr:hypothetical protein [Candidatus Caenarcaniphilales bacterium]
MIYRLVLSFLALSLFTGSAFSEVTIKSNKPVDDERDYREKYSKPLKPAANSSSLSPELQAQVKAVKDRQRDELKALKPQIKAKNQELQSELSNNSIDINALEKINQELFQLKQQENLVKLRYQYELSRFLTAEQRDSLKPFKKPSKSAKIPAKN